MLSWDVGLDLFHARQTAELALHAARSALSKHGLVQDRELQFLDVRHRVSSVHGEPAIETCRVHLGLCTTHQRVLCDIYTPRGAFDEETP